MSDREGDLTGFSEDCCWTWMRDQCPKQRAGKCDCRCHTVFPEPSDWKARAKTAEVTIAERDQQLAALREALLTGCPPTCDDEHHVNEDGSDHTGYVCMVCANFVDSVDDPLHADDCIVKTSGGALLAPPAAEPRCARELDCTQAAGHDGWCTMVLISESNSCGAASPETRSRCWRPRGHNGQHELKGLRWDPSAADQQEPAVSAGLTAAQALVQAGTDLVLEIDAGLDGEGAKDREHQVEWIGNPCWCRAAQQQPGDAAPKDATHRKL